MIDFSACSLHQLLNMISPNFYSYVSTKEQLFDYATNIYLKACQSLGSIAPEGKIKFAGLTKNIYGHYNQFTNVMTFNSLPFECFDICSSQNNTFLPYKIAQAGLHEARHFAQHNNGELVDKLLRNFAVFAKVYPKFTLENDIDYNTNPLEVDARYYAYSTLLQYPYLRQYISHKNFIDSEKKCSRGYSSVYTAFVRANSAMVYFQGKKDERATQILQNLGSSSLDFLQKHNIDAETYNNMIVQLMIRERMTNGMRYNQKEQLLLSEESESFDKEFANIIFNDRILSSEELLKCKDRMFSLKARPQMIERAYFQIRVKAFGAIETHEMYKEFAPKFVELINTSVTATPPKDEINFIKYYYKNKNF